MIFPITGLDLPDVGHFDVASQRIHQSQPASYLGTSLEERKRRIGEEEINAITG